METTTTNEWGTIGSLVVAIENPSDSSISYTVEQTQYGYRVVRYLNGAYDGSYPKLFHDEGDAYERAYSEAQTVSPARRTLDELAAGSARRTQVHA